MKVKTKQRVAWKNYGQDRVELPAGTWLEVVSKRPEGWMCLKENGETFFLFRDYYTTLEAKMIDAGI